MRKGKEYGSRTQDTGNMTRRKRVANHEDGEMPDGENQPWLPGGKDHGRHPLVRKCGSIVGNWPQAGNRLDESYKRQIAFARRIG